MAKQVLKITNWVSGLNCATDPRDIQDSQFAQNWNLIDDRGGILRKVGGAVNKITNLNFDNSNQQIGYGLHTMGVDYSIDTSANFNGTFDDGIERGTVQAYTTSATSITLAAASTYISSADYDNDNYFNNWTILITSGNGAGQSRTITDYTGSSKVATIDLAFSTDPNTSSTYAIFRWLSSDFGTSSDNDWITNNDGSGSFPDTDGNANDDLGIHHLITTKTGITDHQSTEMGYIELKASADSGVTVKSLTIKPGVWYVLSFFAKSNREYFGYVANGVHCDRVPFITLHSTTTTDGTTTGKYLFSNNTWESSSNSTSNVQDNYVTNGDFETGIENTDVKAAEAESASGSSVTLTVDTTDATDAILDQKLVYKDDGTFFGVCTAVNSTTEIVFGNGTTNNIANNDDLYTLTGWEAFNAATADIAFTLLTSNQYGANGNTLQMAAGGGFLPANNGTEIITNAVDRTIASGTINWVEYSPSTTLAGYTEDTSTDDRIEITGTSGTAKEGAELGTSFMTTLVAGRTYKVSASIYCSSGTISDFKVELGGVATAAFAITSDASVRSFFITPTSDAALRIYYENASTTQWYIDNISVQGIDPGCYIYQDLTLPENQWYNLNFVHSSSANPIEYSIVDITTSNLPEYIVPWKEAHSTGGITTFEFLNQKTDYLNMGGKKITDYEKFYVPNNAAASTRTIRIAFSCGKASTNAALDGVTVFKAWNDLVTMSNLTTAINPYSGNIDKWSQYSMKFKLNDSYSEVNDWVFRLYGGRAGFQSGATDGTTADANSRTVEFDNIRLTSQSSDNLIFLNDNTSAASNINIYSHNSDKWEQGLIKWDGIKSKPVYTNIGGALKISDANFDNQNNNKLLFFNNRTVMSKYPVHEYQVMDMPLCENPMLTTTQQLDSQYFPTTFDGISYINEDNDGLDFKTTNWDADKINEMILIRHAYGDANDGNVYLNWLYDADGGHPDSAGCYNHSNARFPIYLRIQGDDSTANDMASILSSGGDIAKVEFKFIYKFSSPKTSDDTYGGGETEAVDDFPGPKFVVVCGKTNSSSNAQAFVDGTMDLGTTSHVQETVFGQEDWDNGTTIKESFESGQSYGLNGNWEDYGKLPGDYDGNKFRKGQKTIEGVFTFERGQIAKNEDIYIRISPVHYITSDNNMRNAFQREMNGENSHTGSGFDSPSRWEYIKFQTLKVTAYDANYTEAGDAIALTDGNEVRVNWNFGDPSGVSGNNWDGRKFDIGITSVNVFDEENWITAGSLFNQGVAPSGTIYGKLGEGPDGSSNITSGQAPIVTLYMGNTFAKDKYRKKTKIYLKDNDSETWYMQFYIDHETGKIHSSTSGYSAIGTPNNTQNTMSWQIPREDMLSFNQISSYEAETLLRKAYMSSDRGGLTCRYKSAVIANNRLYVGNIKQNGKVQGDRMIVSPVNKYNILPDTNFIDVAINDGDEITALAYFKDKLLQFKKKKVFIINTSGDYEFLEDTLEDIGVDQQCQVTTTPGGIAWANEQGCFMYSGQQVINLIDGKIAPTEDAAFITNNYWSITSDLIPSIGYIREKKSLLITKGVSNLAAGSAPTGYLYSFITQSWTFLHRRFPDSGANSNSGAKSNMQIDKDGNLIWYSRLGTSHGQGAADSKIIRWNDAPQNNLDTPGNDDSPIVFATKDFDFGQPAVRKKIYKVYVTYKCTDPGGSAADSKVKVQHSVDGAYSFTDFPDGTNYDATNGLEGSTTWKTAILKPSSSINNIYSFQLRFYSAADVPSGFEVNDMSIIYRIKRVK